MTMTLRQTLLTPVDARYAERLNISCLVQFHSEDPARPYAGQGQLSNLSITGCRIVSMTPVAEGTALTLTLMLPDGQLPLVLEAVHVVRVSESHMAAQFLHLSPEQRRRLQRFIWKHISATTVHHEHRRFRLVHR